jgi:hypothetical protein
MSYMDIDHGEILDMVHRASCVESTMKAWKDKRQAEWDKKDANWERDYDARIEKEEREEKEREAQEKERLALMTPEEIEAEQKEFEERWAVEMEDSDSDSDSDDSDEESDYTEEEMNNEWFKDYSDLSPEDRKAREWEDAKKDSKEWREKRTREIHNTFCYCSWRQLRSYRTQLGLSNEGFEWAN